MPAWNSTQYALQIDPNLKANSPDHGRVKAMYFEYTQGSTAGADGDTINLVQLPAGRLRVLAHLSRINVSALGASRVMNVGYTAFTQPGATAAAAPSTVNADADFFCSAVDVSAATSTTFDESTTATLGNQLESTDGIVLNATITGGTIPAAAIVRGVVYYIQA